MDWNTVGQLTKRAATNEIYPTYSETGFTVKFTGSSLTERLSTKGFKQFLTEVESLNRGTQAWEGKTLVLNQFQVADLLEQLKGPPVTGKAYLMQSTGQGRERRLLVQPLG